MILSVAPEYQLGLVTDPVAVPDDMKLWLHLVQKRQRCPEAASIPEQSYRLADDVPGGPEGSTGAGRVFGQRPRRVMVQVGGIEARVEEGRVAEKPGGSGTGRLSGAAGRGVP